MQKLCRICAAWSGLLSLVHIIRILSPMPAFRWQSFAPEVADFCSTPTAHGPVGRGLGFRAAKSKCRHVQADIVQGLRFRDPALLSICPEAMNPSTALPLHACSSSPARRPRERAEFNKSTCTCCLSSPAPGCQPFTVSNSKAASSMKPVIALTSFAGKPLRDPSRRTTKQALPVLFCPARSRPHSCHR